MARQAGNNLVTERIRAQTGGDDVLLPFSIEVGQGEKVRREEFVWRKAEKGVDSQANNGGFRLVRPSSAGPGTQPLLLSGASDSSNQAASSSTATNDGETLALLEWERAQRGLSSLKHIFTLRFLGIGLSEALGERWKLMVVMTALRLLQLKLKGRTTKFHVGVGEKVHSRK